MVFVCEMKTCLQTRTRGSNYAKRPHTMGDDRWPEPTYDERYDARGPPPPRYEERAPPPRYEERGYDDRRGGGSGYGGYDYGSRGGYDDRGYGGDRGGYSDRGGYDDRGYDDRRGGYGGGRYDDRR